MATSLPYLASYKNVEKLFSKITLAKTPEVFTHSFLATTIGLKGTNDRPLISLLRALGFLDASSRPTSDYGLLRNAKTAKKALATGIRRGYSALFDANERANSLSADELKGLIAQTAGTEAAVTQKISGTFTALVKIADFSEPVEQQDEPASDRKPTKADAEKPDVEHTELANPAKIGFHYNIQVHLPANATEETYLNIFNAIRKTLA